MTEAHRMGDLRTRINTRTIAVQMQVSSAPIRMTASKKVKLVMALTARANARRAKLVFDLRAAHEIPCSILAGARCYRLKRSGKLRSATWTGSFSQCSDSNVWLFMKY